jgi:hypothetical protein
MGPYHYQNMIFQLSNRGIIDMTKWILLIAVLLSLTVGFLVGCSSEHKSEVPEITFEQLLLALNQYNGKEIIIEGYYYQGWETIVLSEELVYSGKAPGHLIPGGEMLWIEQGVPKEIYDNAYQQEMMGPLERYAKVRIKGKFEHGEKYGHLGGFGSQIIPLEITLLSWTRPVE